MKSLYIYLRLTLRSARNTIWSYFWRWRHRATIAEIHRHTSLQASTYPVFLFAYNPSHDQRLRIDQLAVHFAKHGHHIFHIEAANPFAGKLSKVQKIAPQRYQISLPLPSDIVSGSLTPQFSASTQQKIFKTIDDVCRDYDITGAAIYTSEAFWTPIVLKLRHQYQWPLLYDCDEISRDTSATHDQQRLIAQCDLLMASQRETLDAWKTQSRATLSMPPSIDTAHFTDVPAIIPPVFAAMKPPVALYSGDIASSEDVTSLSILAQRLPHWQFLIWNTAATDLSSLREQPNIHTVEKPSYQQLPAYLFYANVGLMPFSVTPTAHQDDAQHVLEYLSVGTPLVALQQPALQHYQKGIAFASTSEQFLSGMEHAWREIDSASARQGKMLAKQFDWSEQIERIERCITEALPKFSIIIIAYKHLALTRQCVESILRDTTYPNYEIIIVDNASPDSSRAYLRYLAQTEPRVKIILNDSNRGFAGANNDGIAAATGSRIVLLNNDTVVPAGWLWHLTPYLNDPTIGLVGPNTNNCRNSACISVPYSDPQVVDIFAKERAKSMRGKHVPMDVLIMFCIAMRRDVLEKLGPLDENFGIGMFEDDDYSERAKRAGYTIVCAQDAYVHHVGSPSFKQIPSAELNALFERNKAYYEQKWGKVSHQ